MGVCSKEHSISCLPHHGNDGIFKPSGPLDFVYLLHGASIFPLRLECTVGEVEEDERVWVVMFVALRWSRFDPPGLVDRAVSARLRLNPFLDAMAFQLRCR